MYLTPSREGGSPVGFRARARFRAFFVGAFFVGFAGVVFFGAAFLGAAFFAAGAFLAGISSERADLEGDHTLEDYGYDDILATGVFMCFNDVIFD